MRTYTVVWTWEMASLFFQTYAEMDPTTAALEKEHEAVSSSLWYNSMIF